MILQTAFLFIFWVLLSGKWDVVHLGFGLLSAIGVACASSLLSAGSPAQPFFLRVSRIFGLVRYSFWLAKRIILAALHVSKLILSPELPVRPRMIKHTTKLGADAEKVLFANSITLTPGTITVDLNENEYLIHSLDGPSFGDIESGAMEKAIAEISGKEAKSRG